jgi:hypothetical protein
MAIIGPGMTTEDYTSGRVSPLDVFEGRIKGWTLAFAGELAKQKDSGIAILLLTSSVFEPMGGALIRRGNSEAKFCAGFLRAFPDVPGGKTSDVAKIVCHLLRDGLFHEGFIKAGLLLEHGELPIQQRENMVVIDPVLFLESVDAAFTRLCGEIRSDAANGELRQTFNSYWNKKDDDQGRYVNAKLDPKVASVATSTTTLAPMPSNVFTKL